MSDCPATGLIRLDGQFIGVICNLPVHDGAQHHDVVHGDWNSEEQSR